MDNKTECQMITVEKFKELLQESKGLVKALNLDNKKSINRMANQIIKKQDEATIIDVVKQLWGEVYDYGGATLEQMTMEAIGYLTDASLKAKK